MCTFVHSCYSCIVFPHPINRFVSICRECWNDSNGSSSLQNMFVSCALGTGIIVLSIYIFSSLFFLPVLYHSLPPPYSTLKAINHFDRFRYGLYFLEATKKCLPAPFWHSCVLSPITLPPTKVTQRWRGSWYHRQPVCDQRNAILSFCLPLSPSFLFKIYV